MLHLIDPLSRNGLKIKYIMESFIYITFYFLYTSLVAIAIKYRLLNVAEVVSTV